MIGAASAAFSGLLPVSPTGRITRRGLAPSNTPVGVRTTAPGVGLGYHQINVLIWRGNHMVSIIHSLGDRSLR